MPKTRLLCRILFLVGNLLIFNQCELFLGRSEEVQITIDLEDIWGKDFGRAISPYSLNKIRLSVFGPAMEPVEKTVTGTSRYLTLTVPAGPQRHFTLELFLAEPIPTLPHLRSFIGRAIADLKSGSVVRILFKMVAGQTDLLLPDFGNNKVGQAKDMGFSGYQTGNFGYSSNFYPGDLDLDATGWIYVPNYFGDTNTYLYFASDILGSQKNSFEGTNTNFAFSLAIDRNLNYDLDTDGAIDSEAIYWASLNNSGGSTLYCVIPDGTHGNKPKKIISLSLETGNLEIKTIRGIGVDPWHHHLFLVGSLSVDGKEAQPALIEYDPFYYFEVPGRILNYVSDPRFRTLNDVLVKDKAIYVLNELSIKENPANAIPVIFMYSKDLHLLKTLGYLSYDPYKNIIPATSPEAFYHPKRFIAQENEGLYIIDDSDYYDDNDNDYDKIVYLDLELSPTSWKTFPLNQQEGSPAGEGFRFFEY